MATIEELKEVLKESLDEKGVLNKIRAQIRSEIFQTLNDTPALKKNLSDENLLINELIREYLNHNGYHHTAAVFIPETGQPTVPPFGRDYIAKKLRVIEKGSSNQLPLLYSIVFAHKKLLSNENDGGQEVEKQLPNSTKFENYDEF